MVNLANHWWFTKFYSPNFSNVWYDIYHNLKCQLWSIIVKYFQCIPKPFLDDLLDLNDPLIGCFLWNVFFSNTSQKQHVSTVIESQLFGHWEFRYVTGPAKISHGSAKNRWFFSSLLYHNQSSNWGYTLIGFFEK